MPRRAGLEVATNTGAVTIRPSDGRHEVVFAEGDGKPYEVSAQNVSVTGGGCFFPNVLGIRGEDLPYVHDYFRAEPAASPDGTAAYLPRYVTATCIYEAEALQTRPNKPNKPNRPTQCFC